MPTHTQRKHVPHSAAQMFDLVAAIDRYPEFLPWCAGARIKKRENFGGNEVVTADLIISYKMFREMFTSKVTLDPAARHIDVEYLHGPFNHLTNHWTFADNGDGTSAIDFHIDFEFRSRTLRKMMQAVFGKAVDKMVRAFEVRADDVYGTASEAIRTPAEASEPSPPAAAPLGPAAPSAPESGPEGLAENEPAGDKERHQSTTGEPPATAAEPPAKGGA